MLRLTISGTFTFKICILPPNRYTKTILDTFEWLNINFFISCSCQSPSETEVGALTAVAVTATLLVEIGWY